MSELKFKVIYKNICASQYIGFINFFIDSLKIDNNTHYDTHLNILSLNFALLPMLPLLPLINSSRIIRQQKRLPGVKYMSTLIPNIEPSPKKNYLKNINPRRYLPDSINNTIMFYAGRTICYFQCYFDNNFSASKITDRLFVGDLASSTNSDAMKSQGITHIVSVFNGSYEMYSDDFEYKIVHINDDPWVNIESYFDETNRFIDKALLTNPSSKVMIHCHKGVSRSVTILMAYILFKKNQSTAIQFNEIDKTINDVLSDVKNRRLIANPNDGFINSLRKYVCRINNY